MSVKETILTPDQKAMEQAVQQDMENKFAEGLVKSFDLPSNIASVVEEEERSAKLPKEEEPVQEEQPEEEVQEEAPKAEEEPEEEGDLIPKSKVQKRIDDLTREKAILESRLRRLEEKAQERVTSKDPDEARLENMSETELSNLKKQIRIAQIKNGSDEAQLNQLLELEEKVDSALRTAPERKTNAQVQHFNNSWNELAGIEGENFTKDFQAKLFQEAGAIYARSNALKKDPQGQAEALWAAYDKLSAVRKFTEGKSKAGNLERQVNDLKKKISVDSSSKKSVGQETDSQQKLFHKAKFGDLQAKTEYFKKKVINMDSLVSSDDQRYYS